MNKINEKSKVLFLTIPGFIYIYMNKLYANRKLY